MAKIGLFQLAKNSVGIYSRSHKNFSQFIVRVHFWLKQAFFEKFA